MRKVKRNFSHVGRGIIKTLIFTQNITQIEIAQRLHTSPQMICDVIAGRKTTAKYQRGIARILGVEVERIFLNKGRRDYVRKTKRPRVLRKAKGLAPIKRHQE